MWGGCAPHSPHTRTARARAADMSGVAPEDSDPQARATRGGRGRQHRWPPSKGEAGPHTRTSHANAGPGEAEQWPLTASGRRLSQVCLQGLTRELGSAPQARDPGPAQALPTQPSLQGRRSPARLGSGWRTQSRSGLSLLS